MQPIENKPWNLWYSKHHDMPWVILQVDSSTPMRAKDVKIHCYSETSKGTPHKDYNTVDFTVKIFGNPTKDGETVTFNAIS